MKELLEQLDKLLAQIKVGGDDVFLMANARTVLGQIYQLTAQSAAREDEK